MDPDGGNTSNDSFGDNAAGFGNDPSEAPVVRRTRLHEDESGAKGSGLSNKRVRWGLVAGAAAVLLGGGALISGCLGGDDDGGSSTTQAPASTAPGGSGSGGSGSGDGGSGDSGSGDSGSGGSDDGGSDGSDSGSGLSLEEAAALPVADTEAYCEAVAVVYGIEASQNSADRLAAVQAASAQVPDELQADVDLLLAGLEAEEALAGADQAAADEAAAFLNENQSALVASGERLVANATAVCGEELVSGGADGPEPADEGPISDPTPEFAPED